MADADDSYSFDEIGDLFRTLKNGKELVIGNRFKEKFILMLCLSFTNIR